MFVSPRTLCATVALVAAAGSAQAVVNPFTEDYSVDASNWRQNDGTTPLAWFGSGGPDGGAYTSATYNFVGDGAGATPAIIRGHDAYDSSGDAFVGDWLSAGVTELSFDIRHDAGVDMTIFARVATASNFPGAGAIEPIPVPSGVWTTISFPVDPGTWVLEFPGAGFGGVFGAVGNVQLGADPGVLAGVDQIVTFDVDKISIVPTPGALALAGFCGLAGLRRRR